MTKGSVFMAGIFLCALLLVTQSVTAQSDGLLVIRGGTLIDPGRDDLGKPGTVFVQNGLIISVREGTDVSIPEGAQVIDATGAFVMPGLADMHNHLRSGLFRPGKDQIGELRKMLDWGVTTTLNPAVPPEQFPELRKEIAQDRRSLPRTFLVSGVFTTRGGWGNNEGYAPKTPEEARAMVRQIKQAGSVGVKLMYDDMRWATTRPFPVMDRKIADAIINEAHRQGMMTFAHAPILEYAKDMAEAGVDCLVHGVVSEPVDAEFIDLMKRNRTCYISTMTVFQINAGYGEWADRMEAFDIDDRLDPIALEMFRNASSGTPRLDNTDWTVERLPVLRLNAFTVQNAGIPMLIGTDAGIPGVLPGISAQLEMVLHQEAGLEPMQILRAATTTAAEVMDSKGVFGTIRDGAQADLIVLDADPRLDIDNIRRIRHVIRAGTVHR